MNVRTHRDLLCSTETFQMGISPRGVPASKLSGSAASILLSLFFLFLPEGGAAQGLPVETGSHLPVALMLVGVAVLGVVIAYGILRTGSRTSAEKRMTDQATKELYTREDHDARR